jgi:hypothetical protein
MISKQKKKIGPEETSLRAFEKKWLLMDVKLPDVYISEEEIMTEVRVVRYGIKRAEV